MLYSTRTIIWHEEAKAHPQL